MASILKVDTIQDQSGNNIINENADTITIGASGDTITIPSGATIDLSSATQTGVGGVNTPAWKVKRSSAQTGVANATETTIICDSEEFDTASAYNTSTGIFTVPSGQGGKYMIGGAFRTNASGAGTRIVIYINVAGSNVHDREFRNAWTIDEAELTDGVGE
jgi:hypothetical protein